MSTKLPRDPDEFARLIDAEEIAAEKASASVDRRAWQSYLRTLEELGLAEEEDRGYEIRLAAQTNTAQATTVPVWNQAKVELAVTLLLGGADERVQEDFGGWLDTFLSTYLANTADLRKLPQRITYDLCKWTQDPLCGEGTAACLSRLAAESGAESCQQLLKEFYGGHRYRNYINGCRTIAAVCLRANSIATWKEVATRMQREGILPEGGLGRKLTSRWLDAITRENLPTPHELLDAGKYQNLSHAFEMSLEATDMPSGARSALMAGIESIRDIILRNALTHILLIVGGNLGITLPVSVRIRFDGQRSVELLGGDGHVLDCSTIAACTTTKGLAAVGRMRVFDDFRQSILCASEVARELWRARHGAYGAALQKAVKTASVDVDFSTAEALLPPGGARHVLEGQSATAAFTLSILAEFLGRRFVGPRIVTGEITSAIFRGIDGADSYKEDDINKWLEMSRVSARRPVNFGMSWTRPEEISPVVRNKIYAADRSGSHQVVIVPKVTAGLESRGELGVRLRLVHTPTIGTAADAAFWFPWRQASYYRAPELLWQFHDPRVSERHGRSCYQAEQSVTVAVHEALEAKDGGICLAVVGPPRSGKSHIVVEGLIRLRDRVTASPERWQRGPIPTWCYFRCLDGEQDYLFWLSLFAALEATADELAEFSDLTRSWQERAQVFAELMNSQATETAPRRRGPDMLILDQFDVHLRTAYDPRRVRAPSTRPFLVNEILRRAVPLLESRCDHIPTRRLVIEIADDSLAKSFASECKRCDVVSFVQKDEVLQFEASEATSTLFELCGRGALLGEVLAVICIAGSGLVPAATLAMLERLLTTDEKNPLLSDAGLALGRAVVGNANAVVQPANRQSIREAVEAALNSEVVRHSHGIWHAWPPLRTLVLGRIADSEGQDERVKYAVGAAHARIAQTLMPSTWGTESASLSLIEEMEPTNAALALFHLDQADVRLSKADERIRNVLRGNKLLKTLTAMPPSLGRSIRVMEVTKLTRPSREAVEDLIGEVESAEAQRPKALHPVVYRNLAEAIAKYGEQGGVVEGAPSLEQCWRTALSRAERWLDEKRGEFADADLQYVLQDIRARVARFLIHSEERRKEGQDLYDTLVVAAEQNGWPWPEGRADLYERVGDLEADDGRAAVHYRRGAVTVPSWAQNIVKYIGCLGRSAITDLALSREQGEAAIKHKNIRESKDRRLRKGREAINAWLRGA